MTECLCSALGNPGAEPGSIMERWKMDGYLLGIAMGLVLAALCLWAILEPLIP